MGGPLPRALLAVLLLAECRSVTADALVDQLWDGEPPDAAQSTLHSTVSRLRRVLEPAPVSRSGWQVLQSEGGGYRLAIPADDLDLHRFAALADDGRQALDAGHFSSAVEHLAAAERLWRGPALVEFADREFARAAAAGLNERRLAVAEDRFEAELGLGRHNAVLGELARTADEHPMRERLHALLALGLYRSGRQADALAALDRTRRLLRDELGLDPGPALRELEQAILRQDQSLAPPPAAGRAARSADSQSAPPQAAVPAPRSSELDPTGSETPPLIGRDVESAQLRGLLQETMRGTTTFALVEGDPGIGKTRVLEELAHFATKQGVGVHWGRCSEADRAPAFWPWREALRTLSSAHAATDDAAAGAAAGSNSALAALLPSAYPSGVDSVPGSEVNEANEITEINEASEARRFALFEAVTDALRAGSAKRPLLVLLEDMHWSDLPSAELLGHLAVRLRDCPVAVVVSLRPLDLGRDDAVADAVASLTRRPGTRRLVLRGVPAAAAAALVRTAADVAVPATVAAAVHHRAEGNPFCIGELTRLLAAESALDNVAAVDEVEVPAGVRDVTRRRLARLPKQTRTLLETFAVLGRDTDLPVLVTASGRTAEQCMDDLEPALTSRIIVPMPGAPGRHRFAHALVREAALAEISSLRLARLHAAAADAVLATSGNTDDEAETYANHLWAAAPLVGSTRAAEALERAADVALRHTAYENADDLLSRALTLRRSASVDRVGDEAELQTTIALIRLRRARRGYSRAFETVSIDRPKELARRSGRDDVYMGLLHIEWGAAGTGGHVKANIALGEQMRAIGRTSSDPVVRLLGENAWAISCWHAGRLGEAASIVTDIAADLAKLSEDDRARLVELDALTLFTGFAVHILDLAGHIDDAESRFRRLMEGLADPYDRLVICNFAGLSGACAGDPGRARYWGEQARQHDGLRGFQFFGAACEIYQGWSDAVAGSGAEAESAERGLNRLEAGLERYLAVGARTGVGLMLGLRSEAALAAGRTPEEVAHRLQGTEHLAPADELWARPYLELARARIALAADAPEDDIRSHLATAVDQADRTGVHPVAGLARAIAQQLATIAAP